MADPSASQTFAHKLIAKGVPISRHDPELSAVTVLIPIRQSFQDDGALIKQIVQAGGCTFPEVGFIGAVRRMGLRGINICDPDFHPFHPESISVDNAIPSATCIAITERQSISRSARLVSVRGICSSHMQGFSHAA
jgi:hypothetical protein